ncbi:MAG: NADH:ubiquinone reductase (Na(+)-transporting) subunit B [Myxococcota bacterium]|jgi:Na+-transporting NADH:ubiquinone oxidoreductase subunit B|nr:NADH:ubiquinone reductase (Na(+)-transporting) subunit B [Myxococcota bacterium]
MKALRDMLDRLAPSFNAGGKLHRVHAVYEALDTFLYTSGTVTRGLCHVRDGIDLKRLMTIVVIALGPCMLMAMYNTGLQANLAMHAMGIAAASGWRGWLLGWAGLGYDPQSLLANTVHGALYFLPVYAVTLAAGGLWEVLFAVVRKHEINEGFLVTSALFPLVLPPTIPLWQVALGISFGVVFGKEIFGGTGRNWMNPALSGRVFLFFAYPAQISGDTVWTAVDGFSGATSLALAGMQGIEAVAAQTSWMDSFLGFEQGSMGETSALACLFGALVLIVTRIGSWRTMAAVLLGSLVVGTGFNLLGSDSNLRFAIPPYWHLVLGGYAFGLVFMATDPVSAALTRTGMWIYGALVGAMVILIRVVNPAYPEGMMLAILFGNTCAPLIDYYVVRANVARRRRAASAAAARAS